PRSSPQTPRPKRLVHRRWERQPLTGTKALPAGLRNSKELESEGHVHETFSHGHLLRDAARRARGADLYAARLLERARQRTAGGRLLEGLSARGARVG